MAGLRCGELNSIRRPVSPFGAQFSCFNGDLRRHSESLDMGSVQEDVGILSGESVVLISQRMNQDLRQCDGGGDDLNVATLDRFKERLNQRKIEGFRSIK